MNLNKVINNLILNIVGNDYPNETIYFNNENNIPLNNSKINKFIIINELYSLAKTALVYNNNIIIEEIESVDTNSIQINETHFQIDFYSNTSDFIAVNNANKLSTALQSYYGTSIIKEYGYSIGKVDSPRNTTLSMDTNIYICRYSVKFSVFGLTEFQNIIEGFDRTKTNFFMEK